MTQQHTQLPINIFNENKTDYDIPSLFLGEKMGLIDSINRHYPDIWNLYKKLKHLDWDENEFDFTPCNAEFKSCSKSNYDMMIKTLAWQWEADSIVSRLAPIVAPFVTSTELWCAWSLVNSNEILHSLTYSEIVRNSFDNPDEVFKDILSVKESLNRLETISNVFATASKTGHLYSLGQLQNNQQLYEDVLSFVVAVFALERLQFMASFAVTFAIADSGLFVPIGKAVQKICQDEFEVHVELDKAIIKHERKTKRGQMAFANQYERFKEIVDEVVESELEWVDYLFSDNRELVGITPDLLKSWVLWCAKDVYTTLDIQSDFVLPESNPLGFMDDWIVNDHQPSPQEEKSTSYMLGGIKDTIGDNKIEFEL